MKKGSIFIALFLVCASFVGCGQERATLEETTVENAQVGGESTTNNKEVKLSTGKVIRIGDDVEVARETYWQTGLRISGSVTDIKEETGHVLLLATGGVVEFNYNYVVDVKARKATTTGGVDGSEAQQEHVVFTDTIRSVVLLDRDGKEKLHFIRDLDNENAEVNIEYPYSLKYNAMEIDEMKQYTQLKVFRLYPEENGEVTWEGKEVPPAYVIAFYKKYSRAFNSYNE